jgi:chaperonin GroEL
VDVVRESLSVPLRTIADNAGEKGSVIVAKVSEMNGSNGFNALTLEYGDLIKDGVITPAKVDRTALQNAASVAGLLLTTDCIITEAPKDKDDHGGHEHGGPPGGMGGMGGGMPGMGGMGGMGF